jgi:hypothetical protein
VSSWEGLSQTAIEILIEYTGWCSGCYDVRIYWALDYFLVTVHWFTFCLCTLLWYSGEETNIHIRERERRGKRKEERRVKTIYYNS